MIKWRDKLHPALGHATDVLNSTFQILLYLYLSTTVGLQLRSKALLDRVVYKHRRPVFLPQCSYYHKYVHKTNVRDLKVNLRADSISCTISVQTTDFTQTLKDSTCCPGVIPYVCVVLLMHSPQLAALVQDPGKPRITQIALSPSEMFHASTDNSHMYVAHGT